MSSASRPHEDSPDLDGLMILFRIISRRSWDVLQARHRACPGSEIEHLAYGLYVLSIPPGGTTKGQAA
jgi:hypothetical protein